MPAGQALTFPIEVFVLVVLPFGSFYTGARLLVLLKQVRFARRRQNQQA
jgi:hypothetical protein